VKSAKGAAARHQARKELRGSSGGTSSAQPGGRVVRNCVVAATVLCVFLKRPFSCVQFRDNCFLPKAVLSMSRSVSCQRIALVLVLLSAAYPVSSAVKQTSPPPASSTDKGQNQGQKPAQITPQNAQPASGAGAAVDSSTYKVDSPDTLNIKVWHEPDFSGSYSVHPDGKITLPLIGDLQAGGKTPVEIEKIVRTALAKYVVNPLVTVTVQEVLSKRYYMDGEINRPGEYALVSPTTVLEAISKAGGLAEFANPKKIYVLRGDQRIPFNYKDVIHGKHLEQNIKLEPGDHIVTP
jgi:polysaccharide biosynthesis/export protein